ncbi:hypothetical protein NPIL_373231 [Nephila pilipes]|uniref:Uncharacterized protein n=1 Tax=Nephila pilipes TaxID=299642 RepID=A0A8X6TD57_NEPPI|nr:hypothetical protein NPIL_373231 [Nephila pilipes]
MYPKSVSLSVNDLAGRTILSSISNSKKISDSVNKSISPYSKYDESADLMFAGISKFEISGFVTGNKLEILDTIKNSNPPEKGLSSLTIKSVEEVKAKMIDSLKKVTLNNLQHCFEQWKTQREGEYVKGD